MKAYRNDDASAGFTCWLTGLPGSGKSTIATELIKALHRQQIACELLDGDIVRTNLSKGLGFSKADRETNVLRVGFVCGLLNKHQVNTVVALIAPYRETRDKLRHMLPNFIEVFVDCPVDVCVERDPKGLYKKALTGEIKNFTGISAPYEAPPEPELILKTNEETVQQSVGKILAYLESRGLICG